LIFNNGLGSLKEIRKVKKKKSCFQILQLPRLGDTQMLMQIDDEDFKRLDAMTKHFNRVPGWHKYSFFTRNLENKSYNHMDIFGKYGSYQEALLIMICIYACYTTPDMTTQDPEYQVLSKILESSGCLPTLDSYDDIYRSRSKSEKIRLYY
jgi:hypothetical protein